MATTTGDNKTFKNLGRLARLMDAQFRVPGTEIKFGLDAIVGLVPGIGDLSTFVVSGFLVIVMAQNGASGFVLARMVLNIVLDAVFGSIPIVGDMFDVAFKANMRNMKLMQAHYTEGRYRGGAWKVVVPVLILVFALVAGLAWLSYRLLSWMFS